MKTILIIKLTLLSSIFIACADGNCRENADMQKKANPTAQNSTVENGSATTKTDYIKVYKYDGTLQCGMGEFITIDKMKADLKSIKVFSAQNKSDGLMHIQLCGSPTGKANVYEILKQDLAAAKSYGFKEWIWE